MPAMKQYKGIPLVSESRRVRVSNQKFRTPWKDDHFRLSKTERTFYKIAGSDHRHNTWNEASEIKYMIDQALKGVDAYKWILETPRN